MRDILLSQSPAVHGVLVNQAQLTIRRIERPHSTPPSELLGPELGDAPNAWSNFGIAQSNSNPVAHGRLYGLITPFVDHSTLPNGNHAVPTKASRSTLVSHSIGIRTRHPPDQTAQDVIESGAPEAVDDSRTSVGPPTAPPPYSQID